MIADANVLIRATARDDKRQAALAVEALRNADEIVVTIPALCEFVWVMERGYRSSRHEVGRSIRALVNDPRVFCDGPAVNAGLAILDAGGDFADGVIAFDGRRLGGDVFVTFDRKAARLIQKSGSDTKLLI